MDIKVGKKAIEEASKKLSNWGRWGKEDQIGTLNHVTPENIAEAHALKLKIIPWTVNDAAEIERLAALGVDGIITDYPDRARRALAASNVVID